MFLCYDNEDTLTENIQRCSGHGWLRKEKQMTVKDGNQISGKTRWTGKTGCMGKTKRTVKKAGLVCGFMAAASLLLGGCAMGGATGKKTVQGISALESEDYHQAQQLFEEAVKEGEEEVLAYRGLGMAYMGLAEYEKAEEAFEIALEYTDDRMPENTQDIQLYLATVQYREEKYEDTVTTCDGILENTSKGNADAYFLRGASYLHEGLQEDAAKDFDAAVSLTPTDYDLYLNIYECYNQQNLSGLGGEYLQSALNIQGNDMEHSYNRGRIYYYLENYEQAQSQLIGPVEQKYEPAMYLIGKVYLAQEDFEHAQAIYQQIQSDFGESAEVYNGLALCAMENGDYDSALTYITQGLSLDGTEGKQELYFNEIVAYERKLDFATAKAKAQEYIQNYPSDEAGQKEWVFLSTR